MGTTVLRSGELRTVGDRAQWSIPSVDIANGASIYLVVDATNGDDVCDSTIVHLSIERL